MLRITKLTDYAIVVLVNMAADPTPQMCTARALARRTGLPGPTVSKVLKELAKADVVASQRGISGGYKLSKDASRITVAEIVAAVEGPIALTDCSREGPDSCFYTGLCAVQANWVRINEAVLGALSDITLAEMSRPLSPPLIALGKRTGQTGEPAHA